VQGRLERSKKPVSVRGLDPDHNHQLKELFKSAAIQASAREGPFREFYQARVAKGMRPEMAHLTLARKIAVIITGSACEFQNGPHSREQRMKTATRGKHNHHADLLSIPRNGSAGQNTPTHLISGWKQDKFRHRVKCFFLTSSSIEPMCQVAQSTSVCSSPHRRRTVT
jgi:hypothetical protein